MPKDETYIIDLCDDILAATAERQHRFAFLLGDENTKLKRRHLPVDAYYREHNLVIEYREVQHSAAVPLWDQKPTLSGISRAEQRRRYDERRRLVMKAYGIRLVEIDYSMFDIDASNRIMRDPTADKVVIRKVLGL